MHLLPDGTNQTQAFQRTCCKPIILPKSTHKLTLTGKVCKECNSGFGDIDTAFVKDAIIGSNRALMDIINDEDRWDNAQEPL